MAEYDPARPLVPPAVGLAAIAVAFGGVVYAMFAAPWFSPLYYALSDLGARGAATAPIFNGALLVGGALGAGFVVTVLADTDDPIRRAGGIFGLLAMLFMALVGAFPLPDPLHGLVAVPFFLFLTLAVFLWGAGDYAVGREFRGLVLVLLGVLHVVSWAWWFLFPWFPPGIAVPELFGSVAFAVWGGWLAVEALEAVRVDRDRL
ncbi:DUF998 domain-containing protein [Halosimplex pelagicum]|uniref:DUF998 domain-containing protein n=1 Tax=Halosimplex pelagicum TaxID=869886 RepID=A0A7D5P975_9EURY|nr:DUF998 domain-containing protein [Halosimplex pelagicum]QLH83937.1 DUF998 domain-containing protein [Halosimplex pelagicum]